ncbi:hypothetical protein ISN44_As12g007460 [Arabidopsis suecica]|uniref:Uncharacterized protein n=1 Tax=Arabidopsis suecica TaxID=45249 RepID=A0A8T1YGT0_ARASU|nr:hypothetical protein ISN44_As12g007460 [Arabidopsis suecica]
MLKMKIEDEGRLDGIFDVLNLPNEGESLVVADSELEVTRLLEALVTAENLSKKAEEENHKEEELQVAFREIERVKVNEASANDKVKKLKKLLS